jgi:tetrahydromethanopterin S-methyltransferase subunit F
MNRTDSSGAPCHQGIQTIVTDIRDRRIWVTDTERQLVFGLQFSDGDCPPRA